MTVVVLVIFAVVVAGGCGSGDDDDGVRSTCEKLRDYNEECLSYPTDVDECIDNYSHEHDLCKNAIRVLAICLDSNSCGAIDDGECSSEAGDAFDECG